MAEVVAGLEHGDRVLRVVHGRGDVARHEGQPAAVDLDPPGESAPLVEAGDEQAVGQRIGGCRAREVHPPLGEPEPRLHAAGLAGGHQGADVAVGEHGTSRVDLVGERFHPAAELGLATFLGHGGQHRLHQPGGAVGVAGRQCVLDGGAGVPVLLVPGAGPPVQLRRLAGELVEEPRLQHVGEEMVVAVPAALVVERHQEQVVAVQGRQHRPAVGATRDGLGQGAGQAREHRCTQEEVANGFGLAVHDLFDEVVDDMAVVTGEPVDEPRGVLAPLERQGGQLQRGGPPLGPALQRADLGSGQLEAHRVEVGRRLLLGEPQVGRAHLDELAPGPQPWQRQGRVRTGRDDEAQLGWQVVDQEGHRLVDRGVVDHVVVVEDQHDLVHAGRELVEQAGQHRGDRRAACVQQLLGRATEAGCRRTDRRQHVGPVRRRVAVAGVEREPRDGRSLAW